MTDMNSAYAALPSTLPGTRRHNAAGTFDAGRFNGRSMFRLALRMGGFLTPIPPKLRPDVNNRTPCQSPGRGRPH